MSLTVCLVGLGIGKTNGAYVGGHVNNVVNTARRLGQCGHDVHIVTTPPIHREGLPRSVRELDHSVRLHTVQPGTGSTPQRVSEQGKRSLLYGIKSLRVLVPAVHSLHAQYGFDLLHSHSGYPWVAGIATAVKSIERIPTVHTLYCPVPDRLLYRTAAKGVLSTVDSVTLVSENVKASLAGLAGRTDQYVVPPLVDTGRFSVESSAPSSPATQSGDGLQLLFVGNFSETKGIDVLVDAMAELADKFPSLTLSMAFDMPVSEYEKAELEIKRRIARLGLGERVTPLGIVEDLPSVMNASDVFVAPFRNTHGPADYPLSLLEAMASGVPVVATDVGGIPEIVDHGRTGVLCSPGDSDELATGIATLLQDTNRREAYGSNAAAAVRELNEGIISDTLEIYADVTGVAPAQRGELDGTTRLQRSEGVCDGDGE